jgi:DNA-binding LytR/AlgR family response regulator
LNNFTYVIIDDDYNNGLKTKQLADGFQNLTFLASANNYDDALDCVLEHQPDLLFLEIDPQDKDSNLSLQFINELHRYLSVIPKVFVTTKNDTLALNAFKYGVYDYLLFPLEVKELRKSLFRLAKESGGVATSANVQQQIASAPTSTQKAVAIEVTAVKELPTSAENDALQQIDIGGEDGSSDFVTEPHDEVALKADDTTSEIENEVVVIDEVATAIEETVVEQDLEKETFSINQKEADKALIICVKSYGDYRYIDAKDICYLQADNNSTDIHLNTGEMITAFKTLKHFEGVLKYPFVRIHNSYILNIEYVSRIHTGNAVCHIKNTTTKLPFSKSYKENIDAIIATIASGNYIEI